MDRNDFFKKVFNSNSERKGSTGNNFQVNEFAVSQRSAPPFSSGLDPYTGSWTEDQAIHLLKRLCYGAPREEVITFSNMSCQQAVDTLLNTINTAPGVPVKTYSTNTTDTPSNDPDWGVPVGKTWVDTPTSSGSVNAYRIESLKSWWMGNMITQPSSIEEKMILFWSTHFAVEFDTIGNGNLCYNYMKTLRQYALGNFKAMTKAITLDPGMLIYLNGYQNKKTAPDENYARELQELFTMGKGSGSQYTQADVIAAARVLTGYQVNFTTGTSYFTLSRHDTDPKQFSSFYNNTIINRTSAEAQLELDDLLAMIFSKDEVSKYICRRLYRYFVYDEITSDTETLVIEPLAATFRSSNYDIKPVLSQLFKSQHFFDALQYGDMIKSGVDFVVGMMRECKVKLPPATNPTLRHRHVGYLANALMPTIEQNIGDPPNVSGFPAYYQSPLFDRLWLSTDTFTKRQNLVNTLVNSSYSSGGFKTFIDPVDIAKRMSDPADPNQLILDFNTYFLRRPLSQNLRDAIKIDVLLTGQIADFQWTLAWNEYKNDPANLNNYSVVNARLKNLALYFLSKLEEYQLM